MDWFAMITPQFGEENLSRYPAFVSKVDTKWRGALDVTHSFTLTRHSSSVDYEIEKGRLRGLATKRRNAEVFARDMVKYLRQAREELPKKSSGEGYALRSIAKWLNDRGIPAKGGGQWSPPQITRLMDTHIGLIEDIEEEFEIAYFAREYVRDHPDYPNRATVLAEFEGIEDRREERIHSARRLAAELNGTSYLYEPVKLPAFYQAGASHRAARLDRDLDRLERQLNKESQRLKEMEDKIRASRKEMRETWLAYKRDLNPQTINSAQDYRRLELLEREDSNQRRGEALHLRRQGMLLMKRRLDRIAASKDRFPFVPLDKAKR